MKRILILLAVVCLVIIAVFQYMRYRKFNMPNSYDYKVAENLDANYHNKSYLADYYTTAYQVGSIAREMWFNHGIDVMVADKSDTQSINATMAYQQLISKAKFLEGKLKESRRLKDLGLDNEDIKFIEDNGLSEKNYKIYKLIGGKALRNGDVSEAVWELQGLLVKVGYQIPVDGNFSDQTEGAVKEFQKAKNQFPSGIADMKTVKLLMQ